MLCLHTIFLKKLGHLAQVEVVLAEERGYSLNCTTF